ncbi:MAG: ABC transporter permease [bacterium]
MKYLSVIFSITSSMIKQRYVFRTLVIHDFKSRYLSSYIGLPWAFIHPAVFVFVIWFAFTFGLRAGNTSAGLAFAPWLLTGMIPWLFISQTMIVTCMAIPEYGYLLKKTAINVWIIPLIKIFSGFIIHLTLIGSVLVLFVLFYGIYPDIYWIQIFYYIFATLVLLTGIAWFVSSINVLVQDMAHIVNIVATVLFWATPIVWPYGKLTGNLKYIALLNPFFYITEGYRYTFLEHRWFFEFTEMNIYFWLLTTIIFLAGAYTFKKLKPEFGDIL